MARAIAVSLTVAVDWDTPYLTRIARPLSVRRQTSQSGFNGLANQGSDQPALMQARMVRTSISWPSSSNRGNFPPGWDSPRRKYRIWLSLGYAMAASLTESGLTRKAGIFPTLIHNPIRKNL